MCCRLFPDGVERARQPELGQLGGCAGAAPRLLLHHPQASCAPRRAAGADATERGRRADRLPGRLSAGGRRRPPALRQAGGAALQADLPARAAGRRPGGASARRRPPPHAGALRLRFQGRRRLLQPHAHRPKRHIRLTGQYKIKVYRISSK